jgi:hypothetical protein
MRSWPRIVSIATAVVWLFLLLVSYGVYVADGGIPFRSPGEMICDLIVVAIVVAAVSFALRPRRWLGLLLLSISVPSAVLLSWGVWGRLSLFIGDKSGFMIFNRRDEVFLGEAVALVTLALLWAVICLRWGDVIKT